MRIVGLGKQDSLASLLEHAEQEYRQWQSAPGRLVLRAGEIEIEAQRSAEGPWERLVLRLPASDLVRDAAAHIQRQFPELCSVQEAGGRWEVSLAAADEQDASCDWTPLEKLYDVLTWPEVWRIEGEDLPRERLSAERLLKAMRKRNASDLHLYPGARPVLRIDDLARPADDMPVVSQRQIEELVRELAPEAAWDEFLHQRQCSFNYRHVGLAFARVSAFVKAGVPHCTIRYLPERIPTFEELHIPRATMEKLASIHEGLLLVSGMTGSGKSTTVASLIDWINANRAVHIVTIEAPVEFVHFNKRAIVSQRDVGTDVPTAIQGVQAAVRHDPDIIVIGEMRDPDTIRAAIDAASTGHLVISTFHANNAAEVPNRIVSFFHPAERDLVRLQLRDCLRCVISQRLLPRKTGGRVPALEFLFKDTVQIEECLLSGNTAALRVAMQQSFSESSIFEESLLRLVRERLVEEEVAAQYATNASIFEQMRLGTYSVPSLEPMVHRPPAR